VVQHFLLENTEDENLSQNHSQPLGQRVFSSLTHLCWGIQLRCGLVGVGGARGSILLLDNFNLSANRRSDRTEQVDHLHLPLFKTLSSVAERQRV